MTIPETDIAQAEDFERDGVVCLRQVFAPHWIDTLARGVERNLTEPSPLARRYTPDGKPGLFLGDYCSWRRIPEYADFLLHSPAAAIAGRFMRTSKINLFHEHVLVKEPGTLEPTPWHHDLPVLDAGGHPGVQPLDPARSGDPRDLGGIRCGVAQMGRLVHAETVQ